MFSINVVYISDNSLMLLIEFFLLSWYINLWSLNKELFFYEKFNFIKNSPSFFFLRLFLSLFCRLVRIFLKTVFGLRAKLLHSDAASVLISLFYSFLCICYDTYNSAKLTSFSSWFKTTTPLLNLSPSSSFLLEENCQLPALLPEQNCSAPCSANQELGSTQLRIWCHTSVQVECDDPCIPLLGPNSGMKWGEKNIELHSS